MVGMDGVDGIPPMPEGGEEHIAQEPGTTTAELRAHFLKVGRRLAAWIGGFGGRWLAYSAAQGHTWGECGWKGPPSTIHLLSYKALVLWHR